MYWSDLRSSIQVELVKNATIAGASADLKMIPAELGGNMRNLGKIVARHQKS